MLDKTTHHHTTKYQGEQMRRGGTGARGRAHGLMEDGTGALSREHGHESKNENKNKNKNDET